MIVFQTGGPGTSTVKYCGSRPPFTGKRDCWKELRIPILISSTNMSLCYTIVLTRYTIVLTNYTIVFTK
jgi:hypothetical protein